MTRREWPLSFTCKHEGCTERATYRYQTRRDMLESWELKNYGNGKGWLCIRHVKPADVLGVGNLTTEAVLEVEDKVIGKYLGSFGFVHGPGFKAFAADLPVGTKLIVTARLELPKQTP